MKHVLARCLRYLRLLRFDFLTERRTTLPARSSLTDDKLALVQSGDVKKWACIKCPGGCGEVINLSLNQNQRPRWSISEDFWTRPSVHPSVHQKNECGCHFWIKKGQVNWCKGGHPRSGHKSEDNITRESYSEL